MLQEQKLQRFFRDLWNQTNNQNKKGNGIHCPFVFFIQQKP